MACTVDYELISKGDGEIEVPILLSKYRSVLAVDTILIIILKLVFRCEMNVGTAMTW